MGLRLGVNIDHIGTIRNARGTIYPAPERAAKIVENAGANGITMHLREDRRHIRDQDLFAVKAATHLPINFEMAASTEMQQIALKLHPNAVCIVPENRHELTTESGLEVYKNKQFFHEYIRPFKEQSIRVSLFIDPILEQIEAAKEVGADIVEIHTGLYADQYANNQYYDELLKIQHACTLAGKIELECHAGHGLNYANVTEIAKIPNILELNIGHFLIAEAIFIGLKPAIEEMLLLMQAARK